MRLFLFAFAFCSIYAFGTLNVVHAQSYPRKTVRIIVPFTAGGGTDTVTRIMARKMSDSTGQQFVIDNRPSAGGNIAFEITAKANPDGYTILNTSTGIVVNQVLYKKVNYRLENFTPVSLVGKAPMLIVVHPSLPVQSIADLVKLAKAKPGAVRFGGPTAAAGHLAMEVFRTMAGVDIQHVPYRGSPQALVDVMSGQIELTVTAVPPTVPLLRANRLRALAQTAEKRSPAVPEIPTVHEAGIKDYAVSTWYVIFGPAGLPADVVNILHTEITKALKLPDVQESLAVAGISDIIGSTPAEAAKFVQGEAVRWEKVIKASGMTVD